MRTALGCLLVALLGSACRAPQAPVGPPLPGKLSPWLGVPPALDDRLVYYNGFEGPDAEINRAKAVGLGAPPPAAEGMRGRGALTGKAGPLELRSPAFSPHKPLTVMFWWALEEDARIDSIFGLVRLGGRGFVSHFSRGKGQWCALRRNAAILQVYNFPGIQNVNGIYDTRWAEHVELRAGVWHHTALVVRGASLVQVYTDGRLAWSVRTAGRPFVEADGVNTLGVGTRGSPGLRIDEVLVLRRALAPPEIAEYCTILRAMRAVGYPAR